MTNTFKIPTVNQVTTKGTDPSDTLANQLDMSGSFNLKIANGKNTATIIINATDTLNTVINNINSAAGVSAGTNYDAGADKLYLKYSHWQT